MKAVVYPAYGVAQLVDREPPRLPERGFLVRVRAAAVNPLDGYFLHGIPYVLRLAGGWRRPSGEPRGVDFAGTVEAAGREAQHFRPGDEVFGAASGAFAEVVAAPEGRIAARPGRLTFEQAAALPVAGATALRALRDVGRLQPGQRVLVHGASGGVGTMTIQIARHLGAEVTAVCSTRNLDLVRALGAARAVDYTREDVAGLGERHDLVIDLAGGRSWPDLRRMLAPGGTLVLVGGPKGGRWLGPLGRFARIVLASRLDRRRRVAVCSAEVRREDLETLAALAEQGALEPVIDRRYPLAEAGEAIRHVAGGHARGKVILTVAGS